MKRIKREQVFGDENFFSVLSTSKRSQVAVMTLQSGEVSGEYGTDHGNSDQTLYVLEGQALVEVEGQNFECSTGDILVIEAGENHRVSVIGTTAMKSLNIYSPPAYAEGDVERDAPL